MLGTLCVCMLSWELTLFRPLEANVEFLHVVVDEGDFIIAHQHLHDVRLDSALWAGHLDCVLLPPTLLRYG